MNQKIYLVLIFALFLGCAPEQEGNEKEATGAVRVSVKSVKEESTNIRLKYSGTVEASQTIPLSFQTTGTVEKVLVDEGDFVKEGQLLATIDETDAQNMYEIAQSKYLQASDAHNRIKSIHDKGSFPEIKWVEMQTNLSRAESSRELEKDILGKI